MPGIAGIIAKAGRKTDRADHLAMVEAMKHESFYKSGVFGDDSLNIRLGWVTLPNSFCDHLPVMNGRKDLVMIFYGEDFSRGSSTGPDRAGRFEDASYIIRLYEEKDESFLLELNGWFTGVLVDLNKRKVFLFNDRHGMQRLYFHETKEAFFFSTEAKSLLHIIPALRQINPQALGEYVAFDCTFGDKALFEGISLLPGASCWTFDQAGNCHKKQYFSPETLESRSAIRDHDLPESVERVFAHILPRYFESTEQVALSLTGGLDTRIIVAGARDVRGVPAYTFAGRRDTFDVRQSRTVSQHAGLRHQVIRLGHDFFKDFAKLAADTVYISDGTLGVNGTHNLYLNRIARTIAPVRLTGLFGSETLREGRIFPNHEQVPGLLSQDVVKNVEDATRRAVSYRQGNSLTAALHRDIPWRLQGSMSIERSQVTLRSPFFDNELVELLYTLPPSARRSRSLQQEVIRRLNGPISRILSDQGDSAERNRVLNSFVSTFYWVLFKLDYLYFFSTPNWFLTIEPGMDFLRLPNLLFGLHKFEDYRHWYRDSLSNYVADILLDRKTLERPYFNADFLRMAVNEHRAGRKNYAVQLNVALTLEMIMRTLIEPQTRKVRGDLSAPMVVR